MGAVDFDIIANKVFFPIYEVIAQDIVKETGISHGVAIDLGCGGGHLGLSLLKLTDMAGLLFDMNQDALEIARKRADEWGLESRVQTILGDVLDMKAVADGSVDLAVSRGSVRFWPDIPKAFSEIYRILKLGGMTYIGGGFGNEELEKMVIQKMKTVEPDWPACVIRKSNGLETKDYASIMEELELPFRIIDDWRGMWILVKKPLDS